MTEGATRTCPKCAETIQAAAKVCRYCRADLGPPRPSWDKIGCVILLVMGLAFCNSVNQSGNERREQEQAAKAAIPDLTAEQRAACTRIIDGMVASGTITERRGGIVRVRAGQWGALTSIEQTTIVAGIACAAYGRPIQGLAGLDQIVVVKDAVTGDTLASAAEGIMLRN